MFSDPTLLSSLCGLCSQYHYTIDVPLVSLVAYLARPLFYMTPCFVDDLWMFVFGTMILV